MLINIILLRADRPVSVVVTLAEYIINYPLVERVVTRLPTFFILQLQVFLHLENKEHLRVNNFYNTPLS